MADAPGVRDTVECVGVTAAEGLAHGLRVVAHAAALPPEVRLTPALVRVLPRLVHARDVHILAR